MKRQYSDQITLDMQYHERDLKTLILNKTRLLELISDIEKLDELEKVKMQTMRLLEVLKNPKKDTEGILNIDTDGDSFEIGQVSLVDNINKILESRTLERAKYYLRTLIKTIGSVKTNKINDINLNRWKDYNEIITDSLWVIDRRDNSGAHLGWYWGNFIPQIPRQIMIRYTKKGDWVLDAFLGSGTTLIECKRLGRNGIGIELNPEVASKAIELINKEVNPYNVVVDVVNGDSRNIDLRSLMDTYNIKEFHLVILHPPYHDIIKFSNSRNDLSNARSVDEFLFMFGQVVDNVSKYLAKGRYLILVIGDKYSKGEWIPLGFMCMNEVMKKGYILKSIVVKNFEDTRGKRSQRELWRYRALVGGFYVFKHEYIFIFKKK